MTDLFAKFASVYADRYKLSVFPCVEMGKTPKNKNGCSDATTDPKVIAEWSKQHPKANIGIATGEDFGIWVLDLDGEEAEAWLKSQPELPVTPEAKTGRGRHIYFKFPNHVNIRNSAGQVAPHVDVRGYGGYVIAPPSVHPDGGIYQWHEERKPATTPFAEAPQWLLDLVVKKDRTPNNLVYDSAAGVENADRYVRKVLDEEFRILATSQQGQRNHQLFKSVAAMSNYIGKGGATTQMVHALAVTGAQSCGLWQDDGADACLATINSAISTGSAQPKEIPPPKHQAVTGSIKPSLSLVTDTNEEDGDWLHMLLLDKHGIPQKKSLSNGLTVLTHHPLMRGVLIYNAFSDLVMFNACPPWEEKEGWVNRPIRDDDAIACSSWLESPIAHSLTIRPHDSHNLMLRVAKIHEIDPPREWLERLEWDGIERLNFWLSDHCQAEENLYVQTVGRKFMIGAVKRLMDPGCKMDSMLILEGPQGKRKSTALRVMATWGDDCYFTDQVDDISNKDALIQIQGVSIIEFAEMDTLNKSDTDHIKKFITRQIDRYRPPYGKTLSNRPRRCVFAGTVNPGGNGYLKDPTGARRFWPVAVNEINIEGLQENVKNLWAEAYAAWKSGEKNWIDDPEVLKLAGEEQASRYEEEPWADIIEREIRHVDYITIPELMEKIAIPSERRERRFSNRIGAYLRHRGWESRKDYRPHGGSGSPQRRFYAPLGHQTTPRTKEDEDDLLPY